MKETKLYWYHNSAYSMEPYFICLYFPNLIRDKDSIFLKIIRRGFLKKSSNSLSGVHMF